MLITEKVKGIISMIMNINSCKDAILDDLLIQTIVEMQLNEFELMWLYILILHFTPSLENLPKDRSLPIAAYVIKVI